MPVLIIQHHELDGPGRIAEILDAGGVATETIRPDAGDSFGKPQDYDAIVVLGGPMDADDEAGHPWLADENTFLRRARRRGIAMLGVNLGAQLICKSADGLIHELKQREFGAGMITLTDDGLKDPIFADLPEGVATRFPGVQWCTTGFEVPIGGENLATSYAGNNQVLKLDENIYGFQFHLEQTIEALEARAEAFGELMVSHEKKYKVAGTYQFDYSCVARPFDVTKVLDEVASVEPHIQAVCETVFRNFFGKIAKLELKEAAPAESEA